MVEETNFLVIPAEGDSVATEQWYVADLCKYYQMPLTQCHVFEYRGDYQISKGMTRDIDYFFTKLHPNDNNYEIHAQGGFGAYVACRMLARFPKRIKRVFFVGGAPCQVMTPIAKFFHRLFIRWWYHLPIEFFADDPNPLRDPVIEMIKASSTSTMRADPKLYCNQILAIGHWSLHRDWKVPRNVAAYFVPNGKAPFPSWWNNTYNNTAAIAEWRKHDVLATLRPGGTFSFYSMMPTDELFKVMDVTR